MKKLLFLLPALALLAAGMTACNQPSGQTASAEGIVNAERKPAEIGSIAYIQMDSLMANFDMYAELSAAFQDRSSKAEADLSTRGRRLENSFSSAQERVQKGLVTSIQARDLETQLAQQQQEFVNYRDQLINQLAEEEQVMLNRIYNSLNEFIKEFNKDYRYGIIITTNGGSPILHADPAFDITSEVITELNKYYAANKENL